MARLTRKVQGSSLIEVIIAMVLICVLFSLAVMIFVRVTSSGVTLSKVRAQFALEQVIKESKNAKRWVNEKIVKGPFIIEKKASIYPQSDQVILIELKVYDEQNTLLAETNRLILEK